MVNLINPTKLSFVTEIFTELLLHVVTKIQSFVKQYWHMVHTEPNESHSHRVYRDGCNHGYLSVP